MQIKFEMDESVNIFISLSEVKINLDVIEIDYIIGLFYLQL